MNNLLQEQLDEVLTLCASRATLACERALRVGAKTLYRAALGEITATTVVCNLAIDQIAALESLAAEIANEYGLEATMRQQQSGSWSVRFAWPEAVKGENYA